VKLIQEAKVESEKTVCRHQHGEGSFDDADKAA
jgi:hypothetical protein